MFTRALRQYPELVKPARGALAASIFCSLVYAAASGFGIPFMIRTVLPALFSENGRTQDLHLAKLPSALGGHEFIVPAENALTFATLLLPLVFLVRGLSGFGKEYLISSAGFRVLEELRQKVFDRLQALHLDFFRTMQAGDISQRLGGDTNAVRYALVDVMGDLVTQPFLLISSLSYVAYAALTTPGMEKFLICLIIVPITAVPLRYVGNKLHQKAMEMLHHSGNMNAMVIENIQAPREIRAYNLQDREISRFKERALRFLRLQMKIVKYDKIFPPLIEFIAVSSISFAIWQAAKNAGEIKSSDIIALVGAMYFCYDPVKKLGAVNNRLKQSDAALTRLEAILHEPIRVADPRDPAPMPAMRGEIVFDTVDFKYPAGGTVFEKTKLTIHSGEVVALVGPSGSGKTTFANLVPRFYDVTAGRVLVDGADVRDVAQAELRARIALVSQEPILFDDTVAANLRIGKPDATEAELETAAEQAGALDFIRALPDGFATRVGERGGLLSGGQRQRLAIARAFLKNAPILILDEATSALDSETEAQVQDALERLARGKTVLIIAHRFSTIRFATRILVFDKEGAGVVADGSHDELIKTSPLYRNLYERQQLD